MKSITIRTLVLTALIVALVLGGQAILTGHNEPIADQGPDTLVPVDAQALTRLNGHFTFLIASDLGRNGYYDQKPVAEMMGEVAGLADPEFIALARRRAPFSGRPFD